MTKPNFYAAAYIIIENNLWEVLFIKRANTGFRDGAYQVPAGHMDWNENMITCAIREAKEEIDIDILESDCNIVHISHRISPQNVGWSFREYFDIYVKVKKYSWDLKINEPHKCSELKFIDIDNIPDSEKNLFSYDLDVIKMINNWEGFSEIN